MSDARLECINPKCKAQLDIGQALAKCPKCGSLVDVLYDWNKENLPKSVKELGKLEKWPEKGGMCAVSGVWRFSKMLNFAPPEKQISIGEGHTQLRNSPKVAKYVGLEKNNIYLQYEGFNPSGSFKDNGMAGACTHASMIGAKIAACASTGNTSASLSAFAAASGEMKAIIFIGDGRVAYGKLSQALDYGATTLLVKGDFDDAMARVQEVCRDENVYLVNSVNPFRIEGQKTIAYRILEGFGWEIPDWIICPGGNLGNSSAIGKALYELYDLGLIKKMPRLAVVVASGSATLAKLVNEKGLKWNQGMVDDNIINDYYDQLDKENIRANTLASAIEIGRPVNLKKCLRALDRTNGVVCQVGDQDILDAKAQVAKEGLGCEPASAASVAGAKLLIEKGIIDKSARVACVLTGHQLKDPHATVSYHSYDEKHLDEEFGKYGVKSARFANHPITVANNLEEIIQVVRKIKK